MFIIYLLSIYLTGFLYKQTELCYLLTKVVKNMYKAIVGYVARRFTMKIYNVLLGIFCSDCS